MYFTDYKDDAKSIGYRNRGAKEILNSLLQTPIGIHQIVIYPNKYEILQEAYFHFIKQLLEDYNEMVIFLPYYESAQSVKNVLSSFSISDVNLNTNTNNSHEIDNNNKNNKEINEKQLNIDVKKYINNGSLVIIDSHNTFSNGKGEEKNETTTKKKIENNDNQFTNNNNNNFVSLVRMSITHAKKLKKEGITILADYGYIYEKNGYESLKELEKSIPYTIDNINIKQICLYNQNDFFYKFTKQEKKEILDLHSRSVIMMDS